MVDPAPRSDISLSRRRFIQGTGAAGVVALLPGWFVEAAAAATPLAATEGILVVINMEGGNDGLNTFVPTTDSAYYDARRELAIRPENTLYLNSARGLHPELSYTKSLWDQGHVAVVDGVGLPNADLSHFLSTGRMMSANASGLPGTSGWLGRVLDGLSLQPLNGLSIGSNVPLLLRGSVARGNVVPLDGGALRSINRHDGAASLRFDALETMTQSPTGLGSLADEAQATLSDSIGLAGDLRPHLLGADGEPGTVRKLRLAARLINANVGIRVLSITFGDFDTHANQLTRHGMLLREFDLALRTFFETLSPAFSNQVLVVGTSEFGRRVKKNANGTDHGTANSLFAIGSQVRGGFYGETPSLTSLDRSGNQRYTVDYRQFCGNLASTWLAADAPTIVGADYADLGFLRPPGSGSLSGSALPAKTGSRRARRAEVTRLYLAYFGRRPDDDGLDYWASIRDGGRGLEQVSEEFAAAQEFHDRYGPLSNREFVELVYRNVLGREGDRAGVTHWTSVLDGGGQRGGVMIGFSESDEFKIKTAPIIAEVESVGPVGRLYRAYFLRRPDGAGLDYWINTGLGRAQISEQFAASNEFRSRYGSLNDLEFVSLAYRNVLGREPDQDGLAHWVDILRQGKTRGEIMLGFSDSSEFSRKVRNAP